MPLYLGSERDWGFLSEPSPQLDNRSIPLPMGKVLGGSSRINGMVWARGHANDWDYATGVTIDAEGVTRTVDARSEVVLSVGAMHLGVRADVAATKRRRRDLVLEEFVGCARPRSTGRPHPDAGDKPRVRRQFRCAQAGLDHLGDGGPSSESRHGSADRPRSRRPGSNRRQSAVAKHEVMPGDLRGPKLVEFIRAAAVTAFHSTGTAKMGRL
jgi:choline dehydrogenase-like flavoprotein